MKLLLLLTSAVLLMNQASIGQEVSEVLNSKKKDIKEVEKLVKKGEVELFDTKYFKIGAGVGYSFIDADLYDAVLSPVDKALKRQKISGSSFVLSGMIVFNKIFYYRKVENRVQVGEKYAFPSWWSLLASLNLAELNASGNFGFNKKIEGGLGVGIRITPQFHIGVLAEYSIHRQLRDFIVSDFENKPIVLNGETLNALDIKDNNLFYDKSALGFAFKFIYLVGSEN